MIITSLLVALYESLKNDKIVSRSNLLTIIKAVYIIEAVAYIVTIALWIAFIVRK